MTSPLAQRYDKARESCALFHMEDWAVFHLTGKDTRDYLHRISTADIKPVKPGHAVQTLFLQGDGRLIADCVAFCAEEQQWFLLCPAACSGALEAQLDRFLFTEEVKVADVSANYYTGLILGPRRKALVDHAIENLLQAGSNEFAFSVTISPDASRAILLIPVARFEVLKRPVYEWLDRQDGVIGDLDLYHTFRIEAGCPLYGMDTSEKTIPLEAGLMPAISFTKGCFPGQEIVARIKNLGHPANVLVGLSLPETTEELRGREILAGGKTVGKVTSVCYSPMLKAPLGLGYVKWAQREPGTMVTLGGKDAHQAAVIELPVPGAAS